VLENSDIQKQIHRLRPEGKRSLKNEIDFIESELITVVDVFPASHNTRTASVVDDYVFVCLFVADMRKQRAKSAGGLYGRHDIDNEVVESASSLCDVLYEPKNTGSCGVEGKTVAFNKGKRIVLNGEGFLHDR